MNDFSMLESFLAQELLKNASSLMSLAKSNDSDIKALLKIVDDIEGIYSYSYKKIIEITSNELILE